MEAKTQPAKSDLAEQFERLYYAEVDPEELAARSAQGPRRARRRATSSSAAGSRAASRRSAPTTRVRRSTAGTAPHTVVEIVNDDMPFLVDSVTMEVNRQGLTLHLVIHPVLRTARDAAGELDRCPAPGESSDGRLESFMHVEVDRQTDPAKLAELEAGLAKVLADVHAAVADCGAMQARMAKCFRGLDEARSGVPQAELEERRAYLAWLANDHFTFLGCRDYDPRAASGEDVLRIVPGSGLGILRERGETLSVSFAGLPPEARKRARVKELLVLIKANSRSTVHRPGHLDYVGVKHFNAAGEVTGETRFLGLYTHTVYAENAVQVPILRRKLAARDRARGAAAGRTQRQGARLDPRKLSARRAAADQRRGPLHPRDGDPAARRAPAPAPAGAPGRLLALRVLPHLRAARALQHRAAHPLPADPHRGVRRRLLGVRRRPFGLRPRAHPDAHRHQARRDAARARREGAREAPGRRDAALGGRSPCGARRAPRRGARKPSSSGSTPSAFPASYREEYAVQDAVGDIEHDRERSIRRPTSA